MRNTIYVDDMLELGYIGLVKLSIKIIFIPFSLLFHCGP